MRRYYNIILAIVSKSRHLNGMKHAATYQQRPPYVVVAIDLVIVSILMLLPIFGRGYLGP
jgi:hypothetical protein